MKNGHCPMCKSGEVYANPTAEFRAGPDLLDLGDQVTFTPYVCRSCGFTAFYFQYMEDMEDLTKDEGWQKVSQ